MQQVLFCLLCELCTVSFHNLIFLMFLCRTLILLIILHIYFVYAKWSIILPSLCSSQVFFYWRHWTVRKELCLFGEPTGIHCLIFAMSHVSCGLSQTSSKGRVPRSWSFCSCLSHTEWLTRSLGMPGECKTLETFSGISCVLFGPSWFTPLWNKSGPGD